MYSYNRSYSKFSKLICCQEHNVTPKNKTHKRTKDKDFKSTKSIKSVKSNDYAIKSKENNTLPTPIYLFEIVYLLGIRNLCVKDIQNDRKK